MILYYINLFSLLHWCDHHCHNMYQILKYCSIPYISFFLRRYQYLFTPISPKRLKFRKQAKNGYYAPCFLYHIIIFIVTIIVECSFSFLFIFTIYFPSVLDEFYWGGMLSLLLDDSLIHFGFNFINLYLILKA